MYPLIFEPIYKEMVWGGERLKEKYNRTLPSKTIGESWDISCRTSEMGIVANGDLKGLSFEEVINSDRNGYLGDNLYTVKDFPLLVKIIDAGQNLSVQVHPDDLYAQQNENVAYGKNEVWYVLDAPDGAFLIVGLKEGVTKENFSQAIKNNTVEDCLNKLPIKAGDIILISSGLVHAITAGVMVAEIQQNSDITYRIYDYDRLGIDGRPRHLHVEQSLEVIRFDAKTNEAVPKGISVMDGENKITRYVSTPYFEIETYDIPHKKEDRTDGKKFIIFTCVKGEAVFESNENSVTVSEGQSVFIPAAMSEFTILGCCTLLKSYVPN